MHTIDGHCDLVIDLFYFTTNAGHLSINTLHSVVYIMGLRFCAAAIRASSGVSLLASSMHLLYRLFRLTSSDISLKNVQLTMACS